MSDLARVRAAIPSELWSEGVTHWPVAHLRQLLAAQEHADRRERAAYAAGQARQAGATP